MAAMHANVAPGDPGAANLGIQVSHKAENNLMLAAYWLCHQDRVSRVPNPGNVTLESVWSLAVLCKADIAYRKDKDMTKVPSIDAKDWPKTIEAIETYLRFCLGQKEIPLAYVVRRDIAVPEADPNQLLLSPCRDDSPCSSWEIRERSVGV